MPEGVARWKQFKKEKQEERGLTGNVGMGLSPSMAEEIAVRTVCAASLVLSQRILEYSLVRALGGHAL